MIRLNRTLARQLDDMMRNLKMSQSLANGAHLEFVLNFFAICMNVLTTSYAQKGFLSIDCGSNRTTYKDNLGLTWITDNGTYMKTGISVEQSYVNFTLLNASAGAGNQALQSYRYFPERLNKYCYELVTVPNASFLIRASFYLNEFELQKRLPFQFVTYINATEWFTVTVGEGSQSDMFVAQEAIFYAPSALMYFCMVSVIGVPFISSLELRQLEPTMYASSGGRLQFLSLLFRYNMGPYTTTPEVVRFPDDSYDRVWRLAAPSQYLINTFSNSTQASNTTGPDVNYVPPKVMQGAWLFTSNNQAPGYDQQRPSFDIYTAPQVSFTRLDYAYTVAYAESLNSTSSSPFSMDIPFDFDYDYQIGLGAFYGPTINVSNQASMQVTPNLPLVSTGIEVQLSLPSGAKQEGSLPLNAFEAYGQFDYNFSTTNPPDAATMTILRSNLSRTDWQGDPCTPVPYEGISCTCSPYCGALYGASTVTSLNLSKLTASDASNIFNSNAPAFTSQGLTSGVEMLSITHSEVDDSAFEFIVNVFLEATTMDLSFNVIDNIPPSSQAAAIWYTNFLISLDLSHNRLTKLDPFENAVFASTLNILDLSYNSMTSFPTTWVNTTNNLTVLDLSHNQLDGAISSLDQLIQINQATLQELYISDNKLAGTFSSSLYFSGLPNLTIAIFDQNLIDGTLNLSLWYDALQEAASQNVTKSNVSLPLYSFVNNSISDIFPSATAFEDLQLKYPSLFDRGILLGGNPYCNGAKSYIQRYLCRSDITEIVPQTKKNNNDITIIGISVGVFVFVLCCVTFASMWKLWKQIYALREIQQALADQKVQPPFYKYNDLKSATRDFHNDNKLGQGGFGIVYKGELEDNTMIAVKKLFNIQKLRVLNEFLNEVVLITGIKHRNLVQLKGCCIEDKQRILVYEYVERGNLAQALWGSKAHGELNWEQRFSICLGLARGLSYLHEELQPSIIHRDIKPENILLDRNLQPKIADFGLARNFSDESSQALFTKVAGTFGYFSPEYATLGELSDKVDVYSYGIVVLEIVSGRKCIDHSLPMEKKFLKYWVQKMHRQGLLLDILQPELKVNSVEAEVIQAINIGLLCVQDDPKIRPSMSQVVTMFMGKLDVEVFLKDLLNQHEDEQFNFRGLSTYRETQSSSPSPVIDVREEDPTSFLMSRNSQSSSNNSFPLPRSRSVIEMSTFLR